MEDKLLELLKTQHQEWLKHPVTQRAIERINEHKNKFVKILSQDAQNTNIPDSSYRHSGINIRNCDAVIALLTNSDLFIDKPKQQ